MSNVNWKMLSNRTGIPISKLRASTKGWSGRPRKLLLETLAMPTCGTDSKYFTSQPYANEIERDTLNDEDASSLWDALEGCWQQRVGKTKRWVEDAKQLVELQREIHESTYIEETTE